MPSLDQNFDSFDEANTAIATKTTAVIRGSYFFVAMSTALQGMVVEGIVTFKAIMKVHIKAEAVVGTKMKGQEFLCCHRCRPDCRH